MASLEPTQLHGECERTIGIPFGNSTPAQHTLLPIIETKALRHVI